MRRQSREEVARAARRRLQLLRSELDGADRPGLGPERAGDENSVARAPQPDGPVRMVPPAGRHARAGGPGWAGWLQDRLPATLQGRVRLGGRELAVVAVLVSAGLALAAVLALRAQGHPVSPPLDAAAAGTPTHTPGPAPTTGPTTDPSGDAAGAATASAQASETTAHVTGHVVVDVAGQVRHPGVFELAEGARVIDALRRAGGARPHVDLTALNLAQVLTDGQQVVVGEHPHVAGGAGASAAAGAGPASGPLVNINTASVSELETLPGVGPVTARRIAEWRTAHGSFSRVDELLEIDGIGDKTLADLAPYVTL